MSDDFAESLKQQVMRGIDTQFRGRVRFLRGIVADAANAESDQFFKVVATDFMGTTSTPAALTQFTPLWAALSKSYAKKKGNELFFIKTRELFHELDDKLAVAILGSTVVTTGYGRSQADREDLERFGQGPIARRIIVTPFSSFFEAHPGLEAGDGADEALAALVGGAGTKMFYKLMNRAGHTRNLLAPALLYFLKYRIPSAIRRALENNGFVMRNR